MRHKKILIIFLSLLLMLVFTGCSNNSDSVDSSRFYKTNDVYEIDGCKYSVNVDKKTDNVYLVSVEDRVILSLYDRDCKIAKYKTDSTNFSNSDGSNVDSSRFHKTDDKYEIDGCKYSIIIDTKTDNVYLTSVKDRVIIPFFDEYGKISKYNSTLNQLIVKEDVK